MQLVFIGLGGFAGAVARYLVDGWVTGLSHGGFPWGTLAVNASGSLVIGLLFVASIEAGVLPAELGAPLMIGFVGAYTTFSTLSLDSWRLLETGRTRWLPSTSAVRSFAKAVDRRLCKRGVERVPQPGRSSGSWS